MHRFLSCVHTHVLNSLCSNVSSYAGVFPFEIARSEVVPGRHNLRLFQRRAGEPIPDRILGGAQFQIDRKLDVYCTRYIVEY
jgi:hypothetical protein